MTRPLRYGEPPKDEDCTDIGLYEGTYTFSNDPNAAESGDVNMRAVYGGKKPDWAIVRFAVTQARAYDGAPVTLKIPGLGRLFYHEKGWVVK